MDPVETAVDVADNLVPPELKHLNENTKWKLWMAGVLTVTVGSFFVHVLLACGYIPFYPGFAMAGEAEKVRTDLTQQVAAMELRMTAKIDRQADQVKIQRINTLRRDLFDARQKQCRAPTGVVRTMLSSQISDMQVEYEALTGRQYSLPDCASF